MYRILSIPSTSVRRLIIGCCTLLLCTAGIAHAEQSEERRSAPERPLTAATHEGIVASGSTLQTRLFAAHDKLSRVHAHLMTHVALLKEDGVVVSDAVAALREADTLLSQAEALLRILPQHIRAVVQTERPQEAFASLREDVVNVRTLLIEAQRKLHEALALLRAMTVE